MRPGSRFRPFPSPARRLVLVWALGAVACSSAPRPALPGEIPLNLRVRVAARSLGAGWHPGSLIRGSNGCRIVKVATTQDPKAIRLLTMGDIARLEISQANPPPDWWSAPDESEGWMEITPERLREEPDRCRARYPS